MKMTENRFDPSALTNRQLRELDRLSEAVLADERPALVGREGVRLELPEPIFNLLVRVVRTMREGKAVVLVSSELPELMGMSDRILMLHDGRVGGEFARGNFTQEALMHAAMGQYEMTNA